MFSLLLCFLALCSELYQHVGNKIIDYVGHKIPVPIDYVGHKIPVPTTHIE